MESVPEWIEDEVKYTCFVIDYLDKKSQSIKLGAAHLSDEQMIVLTALVKRVINNPQKYGGDRPMILFDKLLHIIFSFEPPLQDEDYVSLTPYLAKRIDVYPTYVIKEEEKVYLIDYVLDHISDLVFWRSGTEQFMTSDSYQHRSDIAEICIVKIIERRISSLYPIIRVLIKDCDLSRIGRRLNDLFQSLSTNNISYHSLLKHLNDTHFLIASKPIVEKPNGTNLDYIHERLLSISQNSSNNDDILKANFLLLSFGDNNALQYLYDYHPYLLLVYHPWPSFNCCNISSLALIKKHYLKSLYSMDFENICSPRGIINDIKKNLLRLSLDSEEDINGVMAFFEKLAHKHPNWNISSLLQEVYLSFLENKSAKRTLSESAKRMEDVFEKK